MDLMYADISAAQLVIVSVVHELDATLEWEDVGKNKVARCCLDGQARTSLYRHSEARS